MPANRRRLSQIERSLQHLLFNGICDMASLYRIYCHTSRKNNQQLVLSKSNWFHVSLEMFYESAIAFKSPILVLRYWNMIGWPEQGDLVIVTQFSFSRKDRVYFEIIADCILKSNCRNISRLLYLYTYFLKSNYTHKKLHSRNHSLS